MGKKKSFKNNSNIFNRCNEVHSNSKYNETELFESGLENNINNNDDSDDDRQQNVSLAVNIYLWEFGQNDPKRDSGSKMCRLGYANKLKIGQSFPGIVLSSNASVYVSPADRELVEKFGIAGINCSWNRLDEIPFDQMGKGRNQRLLPLLFAANSVNYGRPFKMNTAEATAACLYITGFKEDAASLLSPFGYGEEFIRLNKEALEAYCNSSSSEGVSQIHDNYIKASEEKKRLKEEKKLLDNFHSNKIGGYMDDMDLPPMDDYEYEDEDYYENGEEFEQINNNDTNDNNNNER